MYSLFSKVVAAKLTTICNLTSFSTKLKRNEIVQIEDRNESMFGKYHHNYHVPLFQACTFDRTLIVTQNNIVQWLLLVTAELVFELVDAHSLSRGFVVVGPVITGQVHFSELATTFDVFASEVGQRGE